MDVATFNLTNMIYCGQGWVYHSRPPLNGRKGNAFRYPIMNLLIPVSEQTDAALREMEEKTFFSLQARDYLDGREGSLESVARNFLKENLNYSPDQIWLQTLPKMWGYTFNPVSFWFCYKGEKLDAVLCEVNNTFGDRHYYFVKELDGSPLSEKVLPKNFHVSPFFPVSGHYRFEFKDIGKTSDIGIRLFEGEALSLDTRIK